jgi:hypothetical protein
MKVRGQRVRAVAWAIAVLVPIAAAVLTVLASPAGADTCTGDATTELTISPTNAVAPVGDSHTVTAKETCGQPGSGDTLRFTVRGKNPQDAEGVTDGDGVLTYSYYDDNGAGTDTIQVCTTGLSTNVCREATVSWTCGEGLFENGVSCSRIPPIDFADRFADLNPGGAAPLGGLPVGALPTGFSPFGGTSPSSAISDTAGNLSDRLGGGPDQTASTTNTADDSQP